LRRQGPRLNYLNPVFKDRIKKEEAELLRRMRDANSMVERYQSSREGGLTFYNALKVERAAVVCSDCRSVRAVAADLKKNLNTAVDEYLRGVELLRATDTNGATLHLKLSQKSCSQMFHQKELLKYLSDPNSAKNDPKTSQLIAFYTGTPMPQLQSWIVEYPPLKRLLNISVD